VEQIDDLVEARQVDAYSGRSGGSERGSLGRDRRGDGGEARRRRGVRDALRHLAAFRRKLAPHRAGQALVAGIAPPDGHDRIDPVVAQERDKRLALANVVGNETQHVVAGNRKRVRGASLADHDNAKARGRTPNRGDLAARLRPDDDVHAGGGQASKPALSKRRLTSRIEDPKAHTQRRVAACEGGVRVSSGELQGHATGASERGPAAGEVENRTDDDLVARLSRVLAGVSRRN
jgi:hypothetical protein